MELCYTPNETGAHEMSTDTGYQQRVPLQIRAEDNLHR